MYGKAPETQQLLDLTRLASVRISQRVEKLELFTGFESANRYDVLAQDGTTIAHAAESTSGMQRFFLGSGRFESIDLLNASGQRVLSLKEQWDFPFSTHHVTTSDGQPMFADVHGEAAVRVLQSEVWHLGRRDAGHTRQGTDNPSVDLLGLRRGTTRWQDNQAVLRHRQRDHDRRGQLRRRVFWPNRQSATAAQVVGDGIRG